tara:strand:- start:1404 stop:1733 length:330 start_codon:yes stop_codon:yes gene_type:complete
VDSKEKKVGTEIKLKIVTTLYEQSGNWLSESDLLKKVGLNQAKAELALSGFLKRKIIEMKELKDKKDRIELENETHSTIHSTTKKLYKLGPEGIEKHQQILEPCYEIIR